MEERNNGKGEGKPRPPRPVPGMTVRSGLSNNHSRSSSRRSRSHSIGSRSHNSRTSRTVSTVSTSNSDHNSRRGRSRSVNNSRHGYLTDSTNVTDEPSDLLGFNSITIDSTPTKKNLSKHGTRKSSRSRSLSSNRLSCTTTEEHMKRRTRSYSRNSSSKASTSTHRKKSSSRSRSCSRQSRASSTGGDQSVIILPDEIEPNVHHNAIMTLEIDGPVIAEMKENELFARRAGINFTKEGGDYLTLVNSNPEELRTVQDDGFMQEMHLLSPSHCVQNKTNDDKELLLSASDTTEYPPNASFLRLADGVSQNQLLGSDQDLAYLRDVAGQLFDKWRGKTSPALVRRLRDFQFAQEKRRRKFGTERPWGILGLYDHLAAVRADIYWAEDAACRRSNGEAYKAWFETVEEQGTGKNRPFFTYIALTLCTAFLVASIGVNDWNVEAFSVNPMIGPSAATLVIMGAKDSSLIVEDKEIWRLLSAMVLHAGFIHYLLNMLALWFIGSAVEQCHGFFPSLLLFVVPAVGGTLLSAVFLPEYITVGASAGIFGLIGACLADIWMNWALLFNGFVNKDNKQRYSVVLLVLFLDIVVNSLVGLTPFVDNFAHLGGMCFGFLCGTSTMHRVTTDMFGGQQKKTWWSTLKRNFFRLFGIFLTVVGLCTALAFLMNGDGRTSPCQSCDALSCMPFPPWTPYESKWWYCDDCEGVTADARINPETSEFDQLSINCPSGDIVTLVIDEHEFETDRSWLESMLPKLCRKHCPNDG